MRSARFRLEELVPPSIYLVKEEAAWELLTDNLILALDGVHDLLHELFDTATGRITITINDWLWKGIYYESGYRDPKSSIGAPGSQHKLGNAADIKVKQVGAAVIQRAILDHQDDPRLLTITRMEANPPAKTWTHIDCAPTPHRIHVFVP